MDNTTIFKVIPRGGSRYELEPEIFQVSVEVTKKNVNDRMF
jgi:hypothetical protein